MTTDIFIDVDGVINAFPRKADVASWGWRAEVRRRRVNGYMITYSPELIERLNAIAARPDVRMHWLTTWCSDAAEKLAPAIGLDAEDWTVVGEDTFFGPDFDGHQVANGVWWKFKVLRTLKDRSPRTVWLDDHLKGARSALFWALHEGILAIAPNENTGLTLENIEAVEAYLDEVPDEETA
jgi:hypothetical protein